MMENSHMMCCQLFTQLLPYCREAVDDGEEDAEDIEEDQDWFYDFATKAVQSRVVHHKNDRRPHNVPIEFVFHGKLLKLWLVQIFEGHKLLTQCQGFRQPNLFVSKTGLALSDSNFDHLWGHIMSNSDTLGMQYFRYSI